MMRSYSVKTSLFICLSFFAARAFSQSDNCIVGSTQVLTPGAVGAACSPTAANTNSGYTDSNQGCAAGTEDDDGWFSFVATSTTHTITIDGAANMDAVLGVYSNCTGTLVTGGTCIDVTYDGDIESRTATGLTIGNTYYICVHDWYSGGGDFTICITTPNPSVNMANTTTTTCNTAFLDNGGTGNYSNNQNLTHTICPATAGQCISVSFASMAIETGYDILYVYDGNSTTVNQFAGSPYTGGAAPGPFTATTTNTSGCITFNFVSDGVYNYSGWNATVSCASCATPPAATAQDCGALQTVCNDQAFSGNSSGSGNHSELNPSNRGCLFAENQSSWYSFTTLTAGTVALLISPSNGSDDYDFAIWGPLASISCPPTGAPLRCSWSSNPGNTGMVAGSGDFSENDLGNSFVEPIVASANDNYVLLVDNYSGSTQPFTLDWTLSNGATLGCIPLPIELATFEGKQENEAVKLDWITFSESNNDFFTVERSPDANSFRAIAQVEGAGNSTQIINYSYLDRNPGNGINYYRMKQTDFDGKSSYSSIISVNFSNHTALVDNIHPNPTDSEIKFDFYSETKGFVHIQIIDYTGRIVIDKLQNVEAGKSNLNTHMGELAKGMYTLKVGFDKEAYTFASKIIKR